VRLTSPIVCWHGKKKWVFSDFSKQKTAKERWRSLISFPYGWPWGISRDAPPPPPESVRTYVRTLVRWRHNQIFSAWRVTNFSYPWCFAGALRALKLRYKRICQKLNRLSGVVAIEARQMIETLCFEGAESNSYFVLTYLTHITRQFNLCCMTWA